MRLQIAKVSQGKVPKSDTQSVIFFLNAIIRMALKRGLQN